ncbi:MAG: uncharacterized protein QOK23_123 [Gammaproteobacteria bacterium]|jgi:uncharacterized membrane protein (UPF0127 family)|nr:uncharacterized protein [Gammaproteobacteria bacterium]
MMEFERRTSSVFQAAIVVGLFLISMAAWPQTPQPEPLSAFPQSLLAVRTAAGKVVNFKIWMADSPRREEQGLMFVREMDEHAGMLFMFPENHRVSMWMKNTYISLDLVFLNAKGKIDYIAANATPKSETIIGPPTPEYAVLELNGGACGRFGIKVGDLVLHKNFKNST